jgi:RecA/RadA recombinase
MGKTKPLPEQITEAAGSPPQQFDRPLYMKTLISTGSTLLDLAISGGVSQYGGIPGRTIVQVYGPNSTGKTTLMAEALGYAQRAGGQCKVRDPEARLSASYCATFGVKINQEDIERTGTITDIFEALIGPLEKKGKDKEDEDAKVVRNTSKAWAPNPAKINFYAVDSLAALASRMEMLQGDKMGQKRAKDFSEGFRSVSDHIYNHNILMFCTDQVRDNVEGYGEKQKPGGGNAVGFYSSLRIKLKSAGTITKTVKLPGMKGQEQVVGIKVEAFVKKSSLDRPFRSAQLRLLFNYGFDDVGANLQWLKDHGAMADHPTDPTKTPGYVVGDKNFVSLESATRYVEEHNFEQDIRDWVVDLWNQIEDQVRPGRKEKVRL